MFNLDIAGFFTALQNIWNTFAQFALSLLPVSPISEWLDYFTSLPYLGYINWFIPFGTCVKITAAWIAAIGAYYAITAILRWAKIIM